MKEHAGGLPDCVRVAAVGAQGSFAHAVFYIDLAQAADPTMSTANLITQGMLPDFTH